MENGKKEEFHDSVEDGLADAEDGLSELADTDAVYSVHRMKDLLTFGQQIDKEFVLSEVQQVLGHCAEDFEAVILPVLCEQTVEWDPSLQFKSAQALSYVVACPISGPSAEIVVSCSLRMLANGTGLKGDDRVFFFQVWSGILVEAIQVESLKMQQDTVNGLAKLAKENAQSAHMESRKAAARIYGALAVSCTPGSVEAMLLPAMLQLYNDANIVVLGTAIESTVKIANKLPLPVVEKSIWPKLMKYAASDDVRIKCTTLRTAAAILEGRRKSVAGTPLPTSIRDGTLNLLRIETRRIRNEAKEDLRIVSDEKYMTLEVLTETFGELLFAVKDNLDSFLLKESFKVCVVAASCNGPLLRRNIAYNFPGLCVSLAGRYGDMGAIFGLLAQDKDDEVRWNLSAGVHETLKILVHDPKSESAALVQTLSMLLTDVNPAVVSNIIEHFKEIVEMLVETGEREQITMLVEDISHLRGMVDGSWRLQELICGQLKDNLSFLGDRTITTVIVPLLWRLVMDGMPPVRVTAARTIVHCLRQIPDTVELNFAVREYFEKLGSEDNVYRIRILLIDAGIEALKVFSSLFFREFFARPLLATCQDRTSNVRLKLALHLHKLLPACKGMPEFNTALTKLGGDADPDVLAAIVEHKAKAEEETKLAASEAWLARDVEKLKAEEQFYTRRRDRQVKPGSRPRVDLGQSGRIDQEVSTNFIKSLRRLSVGSRPSSEPEAQENNASGLLHATRTQGSGESGGNWTQQPLSQSIRSIRGRNLFGRNT